MYGAISYLPLFLQTVNGASATDSGLLLVPLIVGLLVASILAGQGVAQTGRYRVYPILGMTISTIRSSCSPRSTPIPPASSTAPSWRSWGPGCN